MTAVRALEDEQPSLAEEGDAYAIHAFVGLRMMAREQSKCPKWVYLRQCLEGVEGADVPLWVRNASREIAECEGVLGVRLRTPGKKGAFKIVPPMYLRYM